MLGDGSHVSMELLYWATEHLNYAKVNRRVLSDESFKTFVGSVRLFVDAANAEGRQILVDILVRRECLPALESTYFHRKPVNALFRVFIQDTDSTFIKAGYL
jgi:hypothetical protein